MDRKKFFKLLPGLFALPVISKEIITSVKPTVNHRLRVEDMPSHGSKGILAQIREKGNVVIYTGLSGMNEFEKALRDQIFSRNFQKNSHG